jgi:hypothetical protein
VGVARQVFVRRKYSYLTIAKKLSIPTILARGGQAIINKGISSEAGGLVIAKPH